MNNNQFNENGNVAETINLNENPVSESTKGIFSGIKRFVKSMRLSFSKKSDSSLISGLLEKTYYSILSGKIRTAAIFLLTYSIISLVVSFLLNATFGAFISDIDTLYALVVLAISLVLFTTNKNIHSLISGSKILGSLSIVYTEQQAMLENNDENIQTARYSTPVFLGIICGIFTVVYSVSTIMMFLAALLCVLFITNRPEFGMLLIIAILPFLGRPFLLALTCITFISLLYRYMLCKRHISINLPTAFMIISAIYVASRCFASESGILCNRFYIYITLYISFITTINLIRSTSMFRRVVRVIIRMTRTFTIILVTYYLCSMFFGRENTALFFAQLNLNSLVNSLTSASFAAPFIAMAVPLNFAYLVGIDKRKETIKNIAYLILLLASLIYVSSFALILISILSCVAILVFFNKKYMFLVIPAPFAAYALQKLFDSVPAMYRISASSGTDTDINAVLKILKTSPLFGAGPDVTGLDGNMALNVLATFGIIGLVLICLIVISMTSKTIKSISSDSMRSNKARFLSIGLLCSQLSFLAVCLFTNIYCDINVIFMAASIMSVSYCAGRCYELDYIDNTIVREYNNK